METLELRLSRGHAPVRANWGHVLPAVLLPATLSRTLLSALARPEVTLA